MTQEHIRKSQAAIMPATPGLALEGVRIADFSWVWAGPVATKYLATMGAEVIRIESHARLDTSRNTKSGFTTLNYNKKSCTINLQTKQGVDLAKRLVVASDIVVENFVPGMIEHFGLGYETLRELNPPVIMASLSAMGRGGPLSNYVAYGDIIFSYGGHAYLTNYPEGPPRSLAGYWGDCLTGMTAVLGILAALHYRKRTGKGLYLDLSMVESVVSLLPEPVLDYFANNHIMRPRGNNDEVGAPHGCYRCLGDDKWIAIAVFTDREWQGLCGVMGRADLARESRFRDQAGRWQYREELDSIVAGWTQHYEASELFNKLQQAGVSAGPSYTIREMIQDKSLNQRGFFTKIESASMGSHTVTTLPWKGGSAVPRSYRPGPELGEHNDYVFQKLLGLTVQEQKRLEAEKVIW